MASIIPETKIDDSKKKDSDSNINSENGKFYYTDYSAFNFSCFYPLFQSNYFDVLCGFPRMMPTYPELTYRYPVPQTYWRSQNNFTYIWENLFQKFFYQYWVHHSNKWTLIQVRKQPEGTIHTFTDSAKVRFCCQSCNHGWTSMKGRVGFWFYLDEETGNGIVHFKLYGQQCIKCVMNEFQNAMWYPEEIIKVLGNIYNRVGQEYYGFQSVPMRIDRRTGKPKNPHNRLLCQACRDGICKEWNSRRESFSTNEDFQNDERKEEAKEDSTDNSSLINNS